MTLAPGVFVIIWSTGVIGAKYGLPYAEPLTFLAIRFGLAALLMLPVVLLFRAPWPSSWRETGHIIVAGLLLQGLYLGSIFSAIHQGVEAGVAAIIIGIQPILVAILAGPLLDERVGRRQWLGLALGLVGVLLVVWRKLTLGLGTPVGMALAFLALFAITGATLYQKRFCADMPLRSGNVIQFIATGTVLFLLALVFETREVTWSNDFIAAMVWLVLVLTIGAFTLFYFLIRHGAASRVASLFFLIPPTSALFAWLMFGERFGPIALAGMAVAVLGVALVNLRGNA